MCFYIFMGWCGWVFGMYIKEEIINKFNCFFEEGCLCVVRENIFILKKLYKMIFFLYVNNMCIVVLFLIFVVEWLRWVLLFVVCLGVFCILFLFVLLFLIFINLFFVFFKDDLRKLMFLLIRVILFEFFGGRNLIKGKKLISKRNVKFYY